ncbi:MAG: LysR family transcriptional regulator [Oscillospiraceae bacterium]
MTARLELYRIFQVVAEAESFSAAAKRLYVSQSAVSQAMKQLESELQVRLFNRGSRGVTLTADGEVLYEHVRSAMSMLESGESKLAQSLTLEAGKLTIGASETVTAQYLLPYLERFHKQHPSIRLEVTVGRSQKILEELKSGKVDVAFASLAPGEDVGALSLTPCFETHTVFVAAPDYDCDFDHPYTLEELSRFPLILLERKANSRLQLEEFFLSRGLTLRPEIDLGSRYLLVALARIGLGVAGVTKEYVQSALNRGEIRILKTDFEIPARSLDMCILKSVAPSAAARRFMALIHPEEAGHEA